MFKRTNKLPQRKEFSFSAEQISDDVRNVSGDEEQRRKLYACVDEKPPSGDKSDKMQEYLKGSDNLESTAEMLRDLSDELMVLEKQLESGIEQIRTSVGSVNKKTTRNDVNV